MKNIGIIGTGYWGKNHLRIWHELFKEKKIANLVLCEIEENRAKDYSQILGINHSTDYKKLIKEFDIDAVDIVTPSNTHFEIGKFFLEKGIDVLVEKPMTLVYFEAKELIKSAEQFSTILMTGHIFRHHKGIQTLKGMIDQKDFGKIYSFFSIRSAMMAPRKDMGVLFALGIHEVDLFSFLLNIEYPREIICKKSATQYKDIEDDAYLFFTFNNETKGMAYESWINPVFGKRRELVINGELQSALIDYLNPSEIVIFDSRLNLIGDDKHKQLILENEGTRKISIDYIEPLKAELLDFINSISERKMPISDMYSGARAVNMIETLLLSGTWKWDA